MPCRARTIVQHTRALWASRPQLKRDPLGGGVERLVITSSSAATFGMAWLAAALALALHVADEATHDFLAWYKPRALRIRRFLGGFPFPPTFAFWPWLLGLSVAVVLLAALTPLAYGGTSGMRAAAFGLGAVHLANGSLHVVAAIVGRRAVPGVWSAPVLLVAGAWLVRTAAQLP